MAVYPSLALEYVTGGVVAHYAEAGCGVVVFQRRYVVVTCDNAHALDLIAPQCAVIM